MFLQELAEVLDHFIILLHSAKVYVVDDVNMVSSVEQVFSKEVPPLLSFHGTHWNCRARYLHCSAFMALIGTAGHPRRLAKSHANVWKPQSAANS